MGFFVWILGGSPDPTSIQPQLLVRFDPSTGQIVAVPTRGVDVATSFDGLWIADAEGAQVLRFDPQNPKVAPLPINVEDPPDGIAADETHIWIFNRESGTVTIIDSHSKVAGPPIPIGHTPMDIRPWGEGALTVNEDGTITYIDGGGSVEPFKVSAPVVAIAVERDVDTLWAIAQ